MGKKRRKKQVQQIVSCKSKTIRNARIGLTILGASLAIGFLGGDVYTRRGVNIVMPHNNEQKYSLSSNQKYLEQLVEEHFAEFLPYVSAIIYDPGFKQYSIDYNDQNINVVDGEEVRPAVTSPTPPISETRREGYKSKIYFSEWMFDPRIACSEMELLSLIDHEMWHAKINAEQMNAIPLDIKYRPEFDRINSALSPEQKEIVFSSPEYARLSSALKESACYEHQLMNIYNRKFIVSQSFHRKIHDKYTETVAELSALTQSEEPIIAIIAKARLEKLSF